WRIHELRSLPHADVICNQPASDLLRCDSSSRAVFDHATHLREARMISLNVNGKLVQADADGDTPLLWVLRDHLDMTGTKFGCGMALCGACTVHIDGKPARSCVTPVSAVAGKKIVTVEKIGETRAGKAVQAAWAEIGRASCRERGWISGVAAAVVRDRDEVEVMADE